MLNQYVSKISQIFNQKSLLLNPDLIKRLLVDISILKYLG